MSKKFGKVLLGLTAVGAIATGSVYYLLKKKNECALEDDFEDEFDESDFKLDEDLEEVPEREYVSITPASEEAIFEETEKADEVNETEEVNEVEETKEAEETEFAE